MGTRPTLSKIAVLFATALLLQFAAAGSAADAACDRIVGDWAWFIGGKVTFSSGARVRWTPAISGMPPAVGTWNCAPGSGVYTVIWQNGFIDTLNLSPDGAKLSGTSSTGIPVSGQRTSGAASGGDTGTPGVTPVTAPGTAPNNGLPAQNKRIRCPGCPINPDGSPRRIGPQGSPPPKGAG
jgi:hypothetical protein